MIFKKNTVLLTAVLALGAIAPAKADVFKWQDPESKLTVTYPDQWTRVHNQSPDDVLTVMGPGENDHALCRIRVREDKRFAIYPQRYSDNIQHIAFSQDFWDEYLGEYDNAKIHEMHDDAGLGRGFGSWILASYGTPLGPKMDKTAIMFVSHYNNKTYISECSAEKHAYSKWHNSFLSFVKSVDFRKEIHELPTGNYWNFLNQTVKIRNARPMDVYYH